MSLSSCGQNKKEFTIFKTTQFEEDNSISKINLDTIIWDKTFDLDFYKKYFYEPYHYPQAFINPKYKNETVVVWNDTAGEKDYNSNWTNSYTYDSHSRIIQFSYSGCMICSQLPYKWSVYYDSQDRPIKLVNENEFIKSRNENVENPEHPQYILKYDDNNNIIQVQFFVQGKLTRQIDRT